MKLRGNKTYYLCENTAGRKSGKCSFRCVFGKEALHFYFDVKDEDVISPFEHDNEDIWQGDAVEVFLSPDGNPKRYKELEVSPFGVRFYGEITNEDGKTPVLRKIKPDFTAEVSRTVYGYTAAICLRYNALEGFERGKMKLNAFCLDKKKTGEQLLYALHPTLCDSFHRPAYFIAAESETKFAE